MAALGILATFVTWGTTQMIALDARIDTIEAELLHIVDQNGDLRPSRESLAAIRDLRTLEARFEQLYTYLLRGGERP